MIHEIFYGTKDVTISGHSYGGCHEVYKYHIFFYLVSSDKFERQNTRFSTAPIIDPTDDRIRYTLHRCYGPGSENYSYQGPTDYGSDKGR